MQKRIIFFDIDETLVNSRTHQVPLSTQRALSALHQCGHTLCISTGRSLSTSGMYGIPAAIKEFPWDGYVCCNGQFVFNHEKEPLLQRFLNTQSVFELCSLCQALGCCLELKTPSFTYFTAEPDPNVEHTYRFFGLPLHPVQEYAGEPVMSAMIFGPVGWDYAPFQHIPGLQIIPGRSTYADVGITGISKATGNRFLTRQYGFSDYIAFGDSQNDVEMLQEAQPGIAMGACEPSAQKAADTITDSVEENGIWNACIRLKLIF